MDLKSALSTMLKRFINSLKIRASSSSWDLLDMIRTHSVYLWMWALKFPSFKVISQSIVQGVGCRSLELCWPWFVAGDGVTGWLEWPVRCRCFWEHCITIRCFGRVGCILARVLFLCHTVGWGLVTRCGSTDYIRWRFIGGRVRVYNRWRLLFWCGFVIHTRLLLRWSVWLRLQASFLRSNIVFSCGLVIKNIADEWLYHPSQPQTHFFLQMEAREKSFFFRRFKLSL